jgi:hypothetical protein
MILPCAAGGAVSRQRHAVLPAGSYTLNKHTHEEASINMLFLTYFELNEDMPIEERMPIGQKLMAAGLFPPKGVKVLRWDRTADAWGILTVEADSAADVLQMLDVWRMAGAGFFKLTRTSPAVPIQETLAKGGELLQAVKRGVLGS